MTTFDVYVAARPDVNKGRGEHFDPQPKFTGPRLWPTVQTAFRNLLTEDVLQQILSCTQWLSGRARGAQAHTHTHTGLSPDVIPRQFFAAQCESWGLRCS